jgi:non-homologous end joining protein Ku
VTVGYRAGLLWITRRERAVVFEPRGKGIVLWTLRYGDEVRDEKPISRALAMKRRIPT